MFHIPLRDPNAVIPHPTIVIPKEYLEAAGLEMKAMTENSITHQPTSAPELVSKEESFNQAEVVKDNENFIYHMVKNEDTLIRIAVHYGVSEHVIKRYNQFKILGSNLTNLIGRNLRIPKSLVVQQTPPEFAEMDGELKKKRDITNFAKIYETSEMEAKFYLEDNEYDTKKASEALEGDRIWAETHPQPKNL